MRRRVEEKNHGGTAERDCCQNNSREPGVGRHQLGWDGIHNSDGTEMPAQAGRCQRKLENSQAQTEQQTGRRANQPRQCQTPTILFLCLAVDLHQGDDGKNQPQNIEWTTATAQTGYDATDKTSGGKTVGAAGGQRANFWWRNYRRRPGKIWSKIRQQAENRPIRRSFG